MDFGQSMTLFFALVCDSMDSAGPRDGLRLAWGDAGGTSLNQHNQEAGNAGTEEEGETDSGTAADGETVTWPPAVVHGPYSYRRYRFAA